MLSQLGFTRTDKGTKITLTKSDEKMKTEIWYYALDTAQSKEPAAKMIEPDGIKIKQRYLPPPASPIRFFVILKSADKTAAPASVIYLS